MTVTAVRRVVTGHDAAGRATVASDSQFVPEPIASGDAAMALIWSTASVPADANDLIDGRSRQAGTTLAGGSVIRIVDMLPGKASPMHRTSSIDYGIVLTGRLELELDDDVIVELAVGDVIVQRATIHRWRNPDSEMPCRIAFVLIEAVPYRHDGKALPDIHP